jgi:BirA family biotin operon repressor/biotin-[acetyl-CoA-carboxylase] ligase
MSIKSIHRIHLAETDSTNTYARQLTHPDNIMLVSTDYQTAGRGQRSNSWEAERGKNLLFSLAFSPMHIPASQQFILCELISVVLCEVLSRYTDGIRIKWPNDIYHRDRKLSGILIEHDIEGTYIARTIIGIGLNVNQAHFTSDAPNPISLFQILGHEVEREGLLQAIIDHFMELYTQYTSPTPTLSRATLHECYTRLLYRRGIPAPYADAQDPFTATLCTVEPDGRLILKDQQGRLRSYLFKEVSYII